MTYGGAYAVLPYAVQGVVEQDGWLSAAQMIDGLALGESTPGPLVEQTQRQLGWTAPLTAITAAVVGVILHLALLFGQHVLWPQGLGSAPDLQAVAITALAAWALMRWKLGVVTVIGACAAMGLLQRLVA